MNIHQMDLVDRLFDVMLQQLQWRHKLYPHAHASLEHISQQVQRIV